MAESELQYKTIKYGAVLDRSISTLKPGQSSVCQNLRPEPDGVTKRGGQTRLHTTTVNGSNEGRSVHHFQPRDTDTGKLFVQFEDGSVEDVTAIPPATTAGNMGSEVLSAKAGAKGATWGDYRDILFMSDRTHQHQVYTGPNTPILGFVQYRGGEDGTTAPAIIPEGGWDDTVEVSDGRTTTYSNVSNLDDVDAHHRLYIISLTPINKINFEFSTYNGSEVGVATWKFWNGSSFTAVCNPSDGTDGSFVFDQDGSVTFDSPTTEVPGYAFGISGYVYEMSTAAGAMDADVKVTGITVENTDGFMDMVNLWDGRPITPILAQVEVGTEYKTFASDSVEVSSLAIGDYVYILSDSRLFGLRVDVGKYANTGGGTLTAETWDGDSWVGLTETDSTSAGSTSGYWAWEQLGTERKINRAGEYGYCYRFKFSVALDATLWWTFEGLPVPSIDEIWHVGFSCASWKGRMVYGFNDNTAHISALFQPTSLNGVDYTPVYVGDTRRNPILAMVPYYNELLVFQQELGTKGGCVTLIEGDAPQNFKTEVLSHSIGIINGNCHVTLEDANISDLDNQRNILKCIVWLSREGLYKTEGTVIANISDTSGISHFFTGDDLTVQLRKGYEHKHYIKWDSKYQGVSIGLVTGTSATEPNTFLFFDPRTNAIGVDIRAQSLTTVGECAAGSGNETLMQLGMAGDGFLYRLNDGWDDAGATTEDVTVKLRTEYSGGGNVIKLKREVIRASVESANEIITRSAYTDGDATAENDIIIPLTNADNKTLTRASDRNVVEGGQVSIEYVHTESASGVKLFDQAYEVEPVAGDA